MAKFQITFKDPDGVYECVREAAQDIVDQLDEGDKTSIEEQAEDLYEFLVNYIEYGEYITIEFDTDLGTAKVVERK